MSLLIPKQRPALKLVEAPSPIDVEWSWFCGHCAVPSPGGDPPAPNARVCTSCGLGLLLEARRDTAPSVRDAFLVIDANLLVQAVSRKAESLLGVSEALTVDQPVKHLLVPADAEAQGQARFAAAIAEAMLGDDPVETFVRPWNTFGIRMRARIASCGPPRAALLVLEAARPNLRPV
jgi:hypothetical protein